MSTPTDATTAPSVPPRAVAQPSAPSVIFTSTDEGWVCGDPVLHTADGGSSWQRVSFGHALADQAGRLCAAVPGDLWLADGARAVTIVPVQGGSDSAVSFDFPRLPKDGTVTQIAFVDAEHGWVLARTPGDGPGHGFLYRSVEGGARFHLVSRDAPVNGVTFVDAREGWGIGDAQLEHTTDAGATWSVVPTPYGRAPVLERVWAWGSTVVVAGEDNTAATFAPFFFLSTDGGRHFDARRVTAAVGGADPNHLFVAVDGTHWRLASHGRLWRTDDAGRAWASDPLPVATLSSFAFPTPTVGWAIAGSDVFKTVDAGHTWNPVTTTPQAPWSSGLAGVPDACPSAPVVPIGASSATRAAAENAARTFVLRRRGWSGKLSVVTYRVGAQSGEWGGVFAYNVPRFCGHSVADASYGVEIDNPLITQDNSRATALVVGHFADGWRVWGFYR